ncbi:MAG: MATE family efflux transporter, partial [Lachnospiraceae bacterium]
AGGVVMYAFFRKNKVLWPENANICEDKSKTGVVIKELAKLSIPVLGTNVVSCLGYVFFAGMVSGMGTTIFAAHSIAVTAETIFYMPGYGLRIATSAMVGLSYGEKDEKKLHTVSRISVIFTMLMMVVTGTVLFLCAYPLMRLFTSSEQVACIGADMLRIVAFTEPFFGLMVVLEGIFYGLGRTRYTFFVESASMWGIRILFTFLCVKVWGLGLANVWYCMIADNICRALLLALPFIFRRRKVLSVNN